jgi:hypothetical protein
MNPWIRHVKTYCNKHQCSYKDALKLAKASYQKGGARRVAPLLVSQPSAPAAAFDEKTDGIGSAAWKQRKEQANKDFFLDLVKKIQNQEGDFGKAEYLRSYNMGSNPQPAKKHRKKHKKKTKKSKPQPIKKHKRRTRNNHKRKTVANRSARRTPLRSAHTAAARRFVLL